MNTTDYKFALDLHKTGSQKTINAKTGDTLSRKIIVSFTSGGVPFPLDGVSAQFYATMPNNTTEWSDCEVIGDTVEHVIPLTTLGTAGIVDCELKLIGSQGEVIASPRFSIVVEANKYSETESQTVLTASRFTYIKWSNTMPVSVMLDDPADYIGVYVGCSTSAPDAISEYKWYKYKGDPGELTDGSVTTAKLADSAVTAAKIADASVTYAKLDHEGLPFGYKRLIWIGTGTTASGKYPYINTGYAPNKNTLIKVKFRTLLQTPVNNIFCGANNSQNTDGQYCFYSDANGYMRFNLFGGSPIIGGTAARVLCDQTIHEAEVRTVTTSEIWRAVYFDGKYQGGKELVAAQYDSPNSLFFFSTSNAGDSVRGSSNMQLYYASISELQDGGSVVVKHNYIPALDLDGVPCLYDTAEGVPEENRVLRNANTATGSAFSYA